MVIFQGPRSDQTILWFRLNNLGFSTTSRLASLTLTGWDILSALEKPVLSFSHLISLGWNLFALDLLLSSSTAPWILPG